MNRLTTRVLVIDDNVQLLDVLCFLLQADNFEVEGCPDATSALLASIKSPPHICLIDMGLPDLDGYELAVDLRSLLPQAFLIGMSGEARDTYREAEVGAQLSCFLEKPFSAETLADAFTAAMTYLDSKTRPDHPRV